MNGGVALVEEHVTFEGDDDVRGSFAGAKHLEHGLPLAMHGKRAPGRARDQRSRRVRAYGDGAGSLARAVQRGVDAELRRDGDGIEDTFVAVPVGTPVCFEITPKENTTLPALDTLQWFVAFVDVVGESGGIKLDHRDVLFLVPPK